MSLNTLYSVLSSVTYLSKLAGLNRWMGDKIPDKIGTVKCNSAVCLEPGCEYLV